ncbi:hypothetical protein CH306_11030 [Rhodococcus sp. 15-725-2-2b]|jgi:hypothetical protein|uniref:hypothetical protein n=1 Tax=unclassified Rhodococcus (in: high G+C Gram-positive bacteria) TaxID=192944 RepID=UPI000B9A402B|nr:MULTISPECIES: hypothetical protein [unclassified Rhodococcus (in: high G+C Gram-positive bacteria)]OZC58151.1 hypothetical protein CH276_24780 [Rhodococcus sp. 06-470-2]OZC61609.1 hypothetical protein CH277_25675 [Rhodococcus sp. 06-469-3-2]OZC74752.1 hypothetical protein CH274_22430 [Rhodococcus sp. 06-418-5]OZD52392.1 hypothetical protein CH264_00205 [Rhodococcus sp. 06-1477-1A]OZE10856.1 hypothetical protein CH249_12300 [Rhodococcus sp. 05-2255-3B1]
METNNELTVGARVKVRIHTTGTDDEAAQDTYETGAIVEDFGVQTPETTSRDWAVARRWAVALDSGRLVFADNEDLTVG